VALEMPTPSSTTPTTEAAVTGHSFLEFDKKVKAHTCAKCGAQFRFRTGELLKGPRVCS
jgi:nitrite reductase/ring-hydroxylating ferredoxin subunit